MGDEADHVQPTELAGLHKPSRLDVAGIEPALEPDLDRRAGCLHQLHQGPAAVEVEGERLLDQGRLAEADGDPEEGSVGIGRGGDQDGI